jgi:hypothetical protein
VVSVTGNVSGGNIVSGADVSAGGVVSAVGNITGGNINTVGVVSATGNVNAGNLYTNASATIRTLSVIGTVQFVTTGSEILIGTGQLTANNTIGGPSQTGFIQLGRSTATQGVYIANGAVSSGNTKTISIGENGAANSITNINIGTAAGNGNVTFSANTLVAIANTSGTALSVAGNVTGGNISTAGIMSSTGNAIHGNILTAGLISAGGTVTGTSHLGAVVSVTGAITGAAITGSSLTVSTGNISGGNINNNNSNGVGNIGSATVYFNTVFGKATTAQYADLAELYSADAEYTPGTVLDFGGTNEVTLSSVASSAKVAGVVSTNPAHLMNSILESKHTVAVALQGRVPTRVVGTIRKGDMMVTAGNGSAQASATPAMGTVIGKALEDFDGASGTIEIVVGRL